MNHERAWEHLRDYYRRFAQAERRAHSMGTEMQWADTYRAETALAAAIDIFCIYSDRTAESVFNELETDQ